MSWLARASRSARPTHRFAPALRTQQISREFSAVPAGQATRPHILWLYRRIIFAAARFPSKNRDKVYATRGVRRRARVPTPFYDKIRDAAPHT